MQNGQIIGTPPSGGSQAITIYTRWDVCGYVASADTADHYYRAVQHTGSPWGAAQAVFKQAVGRDPKRGELRRDGIRFYFDAALILKPEAA